jgi:hypothetical protein
LSNFFSSICAVSDIEKRKTVKSVIFLKNIRLV